MVAEVAMVMFLTEKRSRRPTDSEKRIGINGIERGEETFGALGDGE
jgi:hypothetical protein